MATAYNPSQARITKALVTSFSGRSIEITTSIGGFEITHSMDMVGYRGHLRVLDSVGLLENFALRGEEKLDLEILSTDINTKVNLKAQIYKIDNVTAGQSSDRLYYKIHFVSRVNYEASKKKVIMPFEDESASYAAEQIFRKYFSELDELGSANPLPYNVKAYTIKDDRQRNFYIQSTEGKLKAIIPNYTPTEAMHFMAQRSYSTDSKSSSFKFFETYDSFYYVTDEFLIKRAIEDESNIIDLIYLPTVSLDPRDASVHIKLIESFKNDKRVDTATDLASGGYANKAIEIDLVRRNVVERVFKYTDYLEYSGMDGNIVKLGDDVHTPEFIDSTFNENNAKKFMIFRDFSRPGDNPQTIRADQYYTEIASNRMFYNHHLGTTMLTVGLKGRLDIQAGKMVKIDAPEFNTAEGKGKDFNKQLSGRYLVNTVVHELDGNILKTQLKLVKYNWSK